MGPTNVALTNLFKADQALRKAQEKLDDATRNVRLQQRRRDTAEQERTEHLATLRAAQVETERLTLDVKTRDEHIDKLRGQQENARNNKEYQALLMEISVEKTDRSKSEEQALLAMEKVDAAQSAHEAAKSAAADATAKFDEMSAEIGDRVATLTAEVDRLRPARAAAAAEVPPAALAAFDRLAERNDGEAMAAIEKPDERREMYVCSACNMELMVDVFNRLHTKDELVICSSCRRLLFIPADLTVEQAVKQKKVVKKRAPKKPKAESEASGEVPAAEEPVEASAE